MDFFADPVMLARIQFYVIVAYHFFFVPLSVGIALIVAINETRYFRTRSEKDAASAKFWVKIFTATFVVGVATGITMEFSFGTNWADYARFVGDIFGAPLAAEALLAFFLESVFLGILLFGRNKVSPKFYLVSSWLVFIGSALSALWILIANSWMQTPAGAELVADGSKAVITDFLAAAFNPSTIPRFTHTVDALIIMGAFFAIAVGAWYLLKGKHTEFAMKTMKVGAVVGIVSSCLMIGFAHASAVVVYEEQPTKIAMMEGAYDTEVPPMYLFGLVDEANEEVLTPFYIPGGTSFLATGTWDDEIIGLNQLAETEKYADLNPDALPVNAVFQSYHIMVAMYGLIMLCVILALVFSLGKGKVKNMRWLQRLLVISPLFPFIAIQTGWLTTELGRQPWVVYPSTSAPDGVSLLISDGVSQSVSPVEIIITFVLFMLIYAFIAVAWARIIGHFIKQGPVLESAEGVDGSSLMGSAEAIGTAKVKAKGGSAPKSKGGE